MSTRCCSSMMPTPPIADPTTTPTRSGRETSRPESAMASPAAAIANSTPRSIRRASLRETTVSGSKPRTQGSPGFGGELQLVVVVVQLVAGDEDRQVRVQPGVLALLRDDLVGERIGHVVGVEVVRELVEQLGLVDGVVGHVGVQTIDVLLVVSHGV